MKLPVEKQNSLIDLYLRSDDDTGVTFKWPTSVSEDEEFLRLAEHNKSSANLFLQMNRLQPAVSSMLKEALEKSYLKIKEKNLKRLNAGIPVLKDLRAKGAEVIILKGNAIAEEVFHDIGYKPMNDIDILVKKEDLEIVHEVFERNQLLVAAPLESDVRKQEKYSHHWPPFFDKKLDVFFGTHWGIAAPGRGFNIPIEDFWREKEEFLLRGEKFYRLSPKHFILHLCIHLNSAKTGLREIGDIVKVIEVRTHDLDAKEFCKMVLKANAVEEVYEALSLAHALKEFPFTKKVLKDLEKNVDQESKRAIQKRLSPRHKILHIRTNYISKIEKTFALFMLTESPVEKTLLLAKMWKLYLFVPAEEALRLDYDFPEANVIEKLMASLTAPAKISRVFIRDMGLPIFVIVTARHQWVLFKSYFSYMTKKIKGQPVHSLDSYAKELGLTFKEMKEISALD